MKMIVGPPLVKFCPDRHAELGIMDLFHVFGDVSGEEVLSEEWGLQRLLQDREGRPCCNWMLVPPLGMRMF